MIESKSVDEIVAHIHSQIDTIVQLACGSELESLSLEEELLIRMIKNNKLSSTIKQRLVQRVSQIQVQQMVVLGTIARG